MSRQKCKLLNYSDADSFDRSIISQQRSKWNPSAELSLKSKIVSFFPSLHNGSSASEDSSRIYVAVGFGFFVEMTHDEALRFIEKKTSQLTASVPRHQQRKLANALIFCGCLLLLFFISPLV